MSEWRCRRDPTHERRIEGKGCYACHLATNRRYWARRIERALFADPFDDVVITEAAQRYLKSFDRYLAAFLPSDIEEAAAAKALALNRLSEGPRDSARAAPASRL